MPSPADRKQNFAGQAIALIGSRNGVMTPACEKVNAALFYLKFYISLQNLGSVLQFG
jgi:hypothetical protein